MRRTKKAKRLAHVQSWRTSGLSRPQYCRKHGLKYATFMSWFKQGLIPSTPDVGVRVSEPGKFIALAQQESTSSLIAISFANGIRIEYEGQVSQELIQYLQDA